MRLTIEIELDGAAVEDGGINEVKRMVRRSLEQMMSIRLEERLIQDINGNTVGRWKIDDGLPFCENPDEVPHLFDEDHDGSCAACGYDQ